MKVDIKENRKPGEITVFVMDKVPKKKEDIIEIECEECKAEFEMKYNEAEHGEPEYCPFCGADLNDEWDDDEEEEFDDE